MVWDRLLSSLAASSISSGKYGQSQDAFVSCMQTIKGETSKQLCTISFSFCVLCVSLQGDLRKAQYKFEEKNSNDGTEIDIFHSPEK